MRRSFLAVLLLSASVALSQPFDIVVAGNDNTCFAGTPITMLSHEFIGGTYWNSSRVAAVAPAPGGRIFAAVMTFSSFGFVLAEIGPDGTMTPRTAPMARHPYALTVDAAGAAYVLVSDGPSRTAIAAFEPSGALRAVYPLGTDHSGLDPYRRTVMDLAADQCTVFVIENAAVVRRFNVCTGSALPDFVGATGFEQFTALRVLPDGDVLVAVEWELRRHDVNGTLLQTYPILRDAYALMLTHNGTRLVYGFQESCAGRLVTLDLETGAVVSSAGLRLELPTSLVSYFGWTAALGAAHLPDAPAASTITLAMLAMSIVGLAMMRVG